MAHHLSRAILRMPNHSESQSRACSEQSVTLQSLRMTTTPALFVSAMVAAAYAELRIP